MNAEAAPQRSSSKPYVIAFVLGAIVLTVLPFMQKQFLKAPPPVMTLSPWSATSLGGGEVSSTALANSVVLVTVEAETCDAECVKRQNEFGAAVTHVDDLKTTPVILVTFVADAAKQGLSSQITGAGGAWRFASMPASLQQSLQDAMDLFLQSKSVDFPHSHAIALLDQNGAVRGFWKGDAEGRGNSINAARLLSKHGPNP